jgi:LAGLIDADG endonuclease
MLENPMYPALPRNVRLGVYHGDNVTGAENQQERLIEFRGWVVGFVDGEGCFSIGFNRQPHRLNRRGYRTGYQVSHRFAVTQGVKSMACLEKLHSFFGVGRISMNERHDNHREHLAQYVVDRRTELIDVIIPFFRRFPMLSAKQEDFEKFAACMGSSSKDGT